MSGDFWEKALRALHTQAELVVLRLNQLIEALDYDWDIEDELASTDGYLGPTDAPSGYWFTDAAGEKHFQPAFTFNEEEAP